MILLIASPWLLLITLQEQMAVIREKKYLSGRARIYIIIHVNSGGRNSPELVSFIRECWETGSL